MRLAREANAGENGGLIHGKNAAGMDRPHLSMWPETYAQVQQRLEDIVQQSDLRGIEGDRGMLEGENASGIPGYAEMDADDEAKAHGRIAQAFLSSSLSKEITAREAGLPPLEHPLAHVFDTFTVAQHDLAANFEAVRHGHSFETATGRIAKQVVLPAAASLLQLRMARLLPEDMQQIAMSSLATRAVEWALARKSAGSNVFQSGETRSVVEARRAKEVEAKVPSQQLATEEKVSQHTPFPVGVSPEVRLNLAPLTEDGHFKVFCRWRRRNSIIDPLSGECIPTNAPMATARQRRICTGEDAVAAQGRLAMENLRHCAFYSGALGMRLVLRRLRDQTWQRRAFGMRYNPKSWRRYTDEAVMSIYEVCSLCSLCILDSAC